MRILAASAALLLTGMALAGPKDRCTGWEFNGYRLGMTRAKAEAVRRFYKEGEDSILVGDVNTFRSLLSFSEGILVWIKSRYDGVEPDAFKQVLTEKIGKPFSDEKIGTIEHDEHTAWTTRRTFWVNAECDRAAVLTVKQFPDNETTVDLEVFRAVELKWEEDRRKQTARDLLK